MPTRMIREGLLDSDRINSLSDGGFVFFIRLMLAADDFGRFDARPQVILSRCYPLGNCTIEKISEYLKETEKAEIIEIYEVYGKNYISIPRFEQRLRAKKSKFPKPLPKMTVKRQAVARHKTDTRMQPSDSDSDSDSNSSSISSSDSNSDSEKGKGKRNLEELQAECFNRGNPNRKD